MAKALISEETIRTMIAKGEKRLEFLPGTIVTHAAADLAKSHGITIIPGEAKELAASSVQTGTNIESRVESSGKGNRVAFGSDHGGFQLKQFLVKNAESLGYTTKDVGTFTEEPCDYPDFAYAVARSVAIGESWRGVMIDGAGIGSCVAANKVPGVRAACCHNEFVARNAREHNDTNVLTLGSRVIGLEVCKGILKIWLETAFLGGRHQGRVDKILDLERKFGR